MRMEGLRDRTKQFSLRVIRMYVSLPKTPVAQVLGRQVLRSGTSVAALRTEADELIRIVVSSIKRTKSAN